MFIIWLYYMAKNERLQLTGYQELEVRTATYGPKIDQSQHATSASHIILTIIVKNVLRTFEAEILKIFKNTQPQHKN